MSRSDATHAHNPHIPPLYQLNESDIAIHHAPTPNSYWSIDVDRVDPTAPTRPTLIVLHVFFLSLAFFVALPLGPCLSPCCLQSLTVSLAIAMRSVNHRARALVLLVFYAFVALGCTAGVLYTSPYPDLYVLRLASPLIRLMPAP